jgi:hypothetical protein
VLIYSPRSLLAVAKRAYAEREPTESETKYFFSLFGLYFVQPTQTFLDKTFFRNTGWKNDYRCEDDEPVLYI